MEWTFKQPKWRSLKEPEGYLYTGHVGEAVDRHTPFQQEYREEYYRIIRFIRPWSCSPFHALLIRREWPYKLGGPLKC